MRALWLALLASGLATSATAQSLIDPDRAWLRRKVDALELRAATDPVGAAEEARALGRELRRAAGAGDGERLRLERRLERIAAGPPRTVVSPGPPRGLDPPPSSLERELFASERDPLRTADLLLARAAEGLAEGRLDAARSDLSLAAAELAVLAARGEPSPALERARRRLAELEAKLPAP